VAGRDPAKLDAIKGEIGADTIHADLQLVADARRVAAEFSSRYARLDVLVNNAGALFGRRQVTAEGLERTFALNHMAYFTLTTALLDLLRASAPARVISVSSEAARADGSISATCRWSAATPASAVLQQQADEPAVRVSSSLVACREAE